MVKVRVLLFLLTLVIVSVGAYFFSLYARGYRFNSKTGSVQPNGLMVIKSVPDGAQLYVNGELKTATNATTPLPPGTYDVSVRKEGYSSWNKRLQIDKEVVTEATAHLFRSAPSLTAVTFNSIENPIPSTDFAKLLYYVPYSATEPDKGGLWLMETLNLPLGFARDPRRITDGNLKGATWMFSPDNREILLKTGTSSYLLDSSQYTSQKDRVNVAQNETEILGEWKAEKDKLLAAKMRKLPDTMESVLQTKTKAVVFSPDEEMILYTASSSATIPEKLIPQLPGSSTQTEDRQLKPEKTYVYDVKEDRNFLIDENSKDLIIEGGFSDGFTRRLSWYPSSRHLILAEKDKVTILDYDGTNKQIVYAGSYIYPNAYPTLSLDRLLILTNFGSSNTPPNLYSLGIK